MLAHPQLHIPRFPSDYSSHHVDQDRPRSLTSQSYLADASSIVSSLSPVRSDSPTGHPKGTFTSPSSPTSPQDNTGHFELASHTVGSFHSIPSSSELCQNPNASAYHQSQDWPSVPNARTRGFLINSPVGLSDPDTVGHYSDSPSPIDMQAPSLSQPSSALPSQDRFPHLLEPLYTGGDRLHEPSSNLERCSRIEQTNKYSQVLDQRRWSEPTITSGPQSLHAETTHTGRQQPNMDMNFSYQELEVPASRSSSGMYPSSSSPSFSRPGAVSGSLRKARHHPYGYAHTEQEWKDDLGLSRDGSGLFNPQSERSVSMHSNFTGNLANPSPSLPYSPLDETFYGPSPPGTGASASPVDHGVDTSLPSAQYRKVSIPERARSERSSMDADMRKNFSFIALPGNAVKKRPRRRFDEIERLYRCKFEGCTKAYGTLNHLNAHVTMQKHGEKRSPLEFRDLRKQWKAAKKEAESQMAMDSLRRSRSFAGHDYEYDRFAFSHPTQRNLSAQPSGYDLQPSNTLEHEMGHGHPNAPFSSHIRVDATIGDVRRYGELLAPSSWQDNSTSSRGLSGAFGPSATQHYPLLPHPSTLDVPRLHSIPVPPSPPRTIHHLPANSTLLTPLGPFQSQPFLPVSHEALTYAGDNYDFYDDSSRPGTGTTSLGPSSGDELLDERGF
ncbi:Zn finger family DNA binding protein [Coprinopsis sp. MPI-PUGE-AT-0042]|nr:Zn finger family DNA binding protein [Coprinopsis sp. MPI-PUGE-AT-0042]